MAEPIIKLTRGVPKTDREWMDVFSKITKFLRVSGDELQIQGGIALPPQSVGTDEIEDESVTDIKLRESQGCSVIGRSLSSAGTPTDIQFSDDTFLVRRAGILQAGGIIDADVPPSIARDADVAIAIADHEGDPDPHPGYSTAAELAAAITAHEGLSDPHPTYTTAAELAAALANITSGTYTATFTGVANVASVSPSVVCPYLRIGNVVTASGVFSLDATAATTLTQVGISLPVASDFAAVRDCGGTCAAYDVQQAGAIFADVTNNRADLLLTSVDTNAHTIGFTFTYLII
jgi:hypothetical protein